MKILLSARFLLASAAGVLLSLGLLSCAGTLGAPEPTAVMANNAGPGVELSTLQSGHAIYKRECLRCHDSVPKPPPIGQPWHDDSVMGAAGLYYRMSDVDRYRVLEYVKAVNRRYFSMEVGLKHSAREGSSQ